jgi:DNA-binding response OmpR family regulator
MALRILIVEDEMTIAFMIEDMLVGLGHDVVNVAMRLSDALKAAADLDVDIAILDVNLDGLMSFPVAEVLTGRGIPFAFATGYGTAGIEEPFKTRPVLVKPFLQTDLERVLLEANRA